MKKLMHLFILSCRRASLLIEKNHQKPLSFMDNIQLSLHLKLCDQCSLYKKQSAAIEQMLKQHQLDRSKLMDLRLHPESKERIKKALENELN